jgi:hypothetical protein
VGGVTDDANTSAPSEPNAGATTPDHDVSKLSKAELIDQITELAGQLNAANYRWLVLIAEFDRRGSWSDGSNAEQHPRHAQDRLDPVDR